MRTPAINVNLKACDCGPDPHCTHNNTPVPVPLSLEPHRTLTVEVVLGRCRCSLIAANVNTPRGTVRHEDDCPGRPIRVSCIISGETWEESEVDLSSIEPSDPLADRVACMAACRERWALVVALVTGKPWAGSVGGYYKSPVELFTQRNAVFAALADMARAERSAHAAFLALPMALRESSILFKAAGPVANGSLEARHSSAVILEHYVERLIEQVRNLP